MKPDIKDFYSDGTRASVIVETKYGLTIHQQSNDRIQFSTPVLSMQDPQIKNNRPLSKNGQIRNIQTR